MALDVDLGSAMEKVELLDESKAVASWSSMSTEEKKRSAILSYVLVQSLGGVALAVVRSSKDQANGLEMWKMLCVVSIQECTVQKSTWWVKC